MLNPNPPAEPRQSCTGWSASLCRAPCRLLWAGAFLASLGAFLLKVRERVRHHAAYPRVTVLDEAEGRVLVFPAVTLRN